MTTFSTELTTPSPDFTDRMSQVLCSWVKASFARMVFSARTSQGISQADLSRRTGIDRSTIVKIENSQRTPSLDVMILLTNELKLDFNILDVINQMSANAPSGGEKDVEQL